MNLWPYRILKQDANDIRADLSNIMHHFDAECRVFDMIVFVPYAGIYLSDIFKELFGKSFEINFVTVRRASTVSKSNSFKRYIFKKKILADIMRHIDVLIRLIKYRIGKSQKMVTELEINFDVNGKNILIIDDDIATGTTLNKVKSILLEHGAASVTTGCISNHFLPDEIKVDYSVHRYVLLRTKNSRDFDAT
ncbi:MAG TPA: phosphoribosyltransferase [Sedimentisphaerales bacterium]|nr:phosphoribosyltransferase [Sedimentisphaerales bacterium]